MFSFFFRGAGFLLLVTICIFIVDVQAQSLTNEPSYQAVLIEGGDQAKIRELFLTNVGMFKPGSIDAIHDFARECGIAEITETRKDVFHLGCENGYYSHADFDLATGTLNISPDGSIAVKFGSGASVKFTAKDIIKDIFTNNSESVSLQNLVRFHRPKPLPITQTWQTRTRKSDSGFEVPDMTSECIYRPCARYVDPGHDWDVFPYVHDSFVTISNSQLTRMTNLTKGRRSTTSHPYTEPPASMPSVTREIFDLKISSGDFLVKDHALNAYHGMASFKRIDLSNRRLFFTLQTSKEVSAWNTSKTCGRSDWKINQELECPGPFPPLFGILATTDDALWYMLTNSKSDRDSDQFAFRSSTGAESFTFSLFLPPGNVPQGWTDVSPGGDCARDPFNCSYRHNSRNITITLDQPPMDWSSADKRCQTLNFGGYTSGWRLPTQQEFQALYLEKMNNLPLRRPFNWSKWQWTSTPSSNVPGSFQTVAWGFGQVDVSNDDASSMVDFLCVR